MPPVAAHQSEARCSAKGGYIALLSILIVAAIAASTVLILFVTSLNTALNSADVSQGKTSKALAEACAELALQRLTSGLSTPCSGCPLTYPFTGQGSCQIYSIINTSGINWQIRTTGTSDAGTITKYLELTATRAAPGSVAVLRSWKECLNFSTSPCPVP